MTQDVIPTVENSYRVFKTEGWYIGKEMIRMQVTGTTGDGR